MWRNVILRFITHNVIWTGMLCKNNAWHNIAHIQISLQLRNYTTSKSDISREKFEAHGKEQSVTGLTSCVTGLNACIILS